MDKYKVTVNTKKKYKTQISREVYVYANDPEKATISAFAALEKEIYGFNKNRWFIKEIQKIGG